MSNTPDGVPGRTSRSARGTTPRPANRPVNRPVSRWERRRTFGLGICVGMTVALTISAVAFFTTRPAPLRSVANAAGGSSHSGHNGQPVSQGGAAAPAASIDITATHVGDLRVIIDVLVSAPKTYDPITMAQVAAYTDMVAMPTSHKQGPIMLTEGQPGHYQAMTTVPMIGEYDITVEVSSPMAATAHKRLNVTTVTPTKP